MVKTNLKEFKTNIRGLILTKLYKSKNYKKVVKNNVKFVKNVLTNKTKSGKGNKQGTGDTAKKLRFRNRKNKKSVRTTYFLPTTQQNLEIISAFEKGTPQKKVSSNIDSIYYDSQIQKWLNKSKSSNFKSYSNKFNVSEIENLKLFRTGLNNKNKLNKKIGNPLVLGINKLFKKIRF